MNASLFLRTVIIASSLSCCLAFFSQLPNALALDFGSVTFPSRPIGWVYALTGHDSWFPFEIARDSVVRPPANLGLLLSDSAGFDLRCLDGLSSDDLQALWLPGINVGDSGLSHIGRLTGLQELDLSDCGITDAGLVHLTDLKQLRTLRLSGNKLTGAGLRAIAELPQLTELDLQDICCAESEKSKEVGTVRFASERSLALQRACLQELPQLDSVRTLSVDGASLSDQRALSLNNLVLLEDVSLYPFESGCDVFAEALANLRHLKRLRLGGPHNPLNTSFLAAAKLPVLERLSCITTEIDANLAAACAKMRRLRSLSLIVSDKPISCADLSRLPRLMRLKLETKLPTQMAELARLGRLKSIELWTDDAGFRDLCSIKGLEHLCVSGCPLTDSSVTDINKLRQLTRLDLSRTQIGDASLKLIAQLPHLERLDLSQTRVTDAGLPELARLKGLRALRLEGTAITDDGLKGLSALAELEELDLANTRVRGTGLLSLSGLIKLERIRMGPVLNSSLGALAGLRALRCLWLDNATVTPVGIDNICRLRNLEILAVGKLEASAADAAKMAQMPTLRYLYLPDPGAHVDILQRQLPALRVGSFQLPEYLQRRRLLIPANHEARFDSCW